MTLQHQDVFERYYARPQGSRDGEKIKRIRKDQKPETVEEQEEKQTDKH